jgi:cytochrome P450
MTMVDMNHSEEIIPKSFDFVPERSINNPKTMLGLFLTRYFVSFGKGSRSFLGLHLAQAELHIGLAAPFGDSSSSFMRLMSRIRGSLTIVL